LYLYGIDDDGDSWLIRFNDSLERGKYFHKVDMFGNKYIVEKDELIDYIEKHYNPEIEPDEERYISVCSEHLIKNKWIK
jgi:hypothetical protein